MPYNVPSAFLGAQLLPVPPAQAQNQDQIRPWNPFSREDVCFHRSIALDLHAKGFRAARAHLCTPSVPVPLLCKQLCIPSCAPQSQEPPCTGDGDISYKY